MTYEEFEKEWKGFTPEGRDRVVRLLMLLKNGVLKYSDEKSGFLIDNKFTAMMYMQNGIPVEMLPNMVKQVILQK